MDNRHDMGVGGGGGEITQRKENESSHREDESKERQNVSQIFLRTNEILIPNDKTKGQEILDYAV